MNAHLYQSDHVQDALGYARCVHCGLPKRNKIHDLPELDPDAAVVTARIIGEGTDVARPD